MDEHLWYYFGIPHTDEQMKWLVRTEQRRLCFEVGSCAAEEVGLFLGPITLPFRWGGAAISGGFDLIKLIYIGDPDGGIVEGGILAANRSKFFEVLGESSAEGVGIPARIGRAVGGILLSGVSYALDVASYVDEMEQFGPDAERNVNNRIAAQRSRLQYYWGTGYVSGQ